MFTLGLIIGAAGGGAAVWFFKDQLVDLRDWIKSWF